MPIKTHIKLKQKIICYFYSANKIYILVKQIQLNVKLSKYINITMSLVNQFIENNLQSSISHQTLRSIQQQSSAIQDLLNNISHLRQINKVQAIENKITAIQNYLTLKQDILAFIQHCNQQQFMNWAHQSFGIKGFTIELVRNQHLNFKRMLITKMKQLFILQDHNSSMEDMEMREYRQILKNIKQIEISGKNVGYNILSKATHLQYKYQEYMKAFNTKIQQFNISIMRISKNIIEYEKKVRNQLKSILQLKQSPYEKQVYENQNISSFSPQKYSESFQQHSYNPMYSQASFYQNKQLSSYEPRRNQKIYQSPHTPMMEINKNTEQDISFPASRDNSRISYKNALPVKSFIGQEKYRDESYSNLPMESINDNFYRQKSSLSSFIPTNDITLRNYYY